jgi:hypothetical protein
MGLQIVFLDDPVRPHPARDSVLGDHHPACLDQPPGHRMRGRRPWSASCQQSVRGYAGAPGTIRNQCSLVGHHPHVPAIWRVCGNSRFFCEKPARAPLARPLWNWQVFPVRVQGLLRPDRHLYACQAMAAKARALGMTCAIRGYRLCFPSRSTPREGQSWCLCHEIDRCQLALLEIYYNSHI